MKKILRGVSEWSITAIGEKEIEVLFGGYTAAAILKKFRLFLYVTSGAGDAVRGCSLL